MSTATFYSSRSHDFLSGDENVHCRGAFESGCKAFLNSYSHVGRLFDTFVGGIAGGNCRNDGHLVSVLYGNTANGFPDRLHLTAHSYSCQPGLQ